MPDPDPDTAAEAPATNRDRVALLDAKINALQALVDQLQEELVKSRSLLPMGMVCARIQRHFDDVVRAVRESGVTQYFRDGVAWLAEGDIDAVRRQIDRHEWERQT